MFSHPNIKESYSSFSEKCCYRGSLGILEGGYRILPKALELAQQL
jgi:2,3-bisphosphoglycerate-independent phosphoglycerate mutase